MAPSGTLSFQEAEAALARAALKASQQDFDAAYDLYVRAARAFIHLALNNTPSSSGSQTQRTSSNARCREYAAQALERAEQIKARRTILSSPASGAAKSTQVTRTLTVDMYSEEDQLAVLNRSTRVNGHKFVPWEPQHGSDSPSINALFKDSDGLLTLSKPQYELLDKWWRPCEDQEGQVMTTPNLATEDIYQHIVTNCSVIAGLAVCWEHNLRFGSQLCTASIFPQQDDGSPQLRPDGRYTVRLLFNGTYRQASLVDDSLPATKSGQLLCASTRGLRVLWPSIIEKAYMKVMGGYDFPGSNPAIDLHAIIGWIPEEIDFHSTGFQEQKTWSRMYNGFQSGRCLATLGTGKELRKASAGPNLVPLHGYSVIDMDESPSSARLKIMNPWITPSTGSAETSSRSIWMDWSEVCAVFDGLYLNWDPAMFKHSRSLHGFWRREGNRKRSCHRLRFEVDAASGSGTEETPPEMWFLLTRHVVSRNDPSEFISLDAVGRGGKSNAFSEDLLSEKSAYTDSTHILRRVSLKNSSRVSVMLSRDMEDLNEDDRNRPVAFTLTVYSHSAINLMQPPPKRPYSAEDEGKFTSRTSGGNPTHRTFMHNPQYKLRLQPGPGQGIHPLGFRLIVEASRSVAIKATVVWGGGKRISGLNRGDVQLDTGPYVYGTAAIGGLLKPSDYTLVLSTFTPGQQSPYYISVEADGPVSLEAIPSEGAGMFSKSVKGKWLGPSAAGNPSFGRYRLNPRFDLRISQRTSLFCRLQHVDAPSGTAINVTIFRKDDAGQTNEQVVTSGSYADAVCGVVTSPVQLHGPAVYAVIVSTFEPDVEAGFELTAYSSACPISLSVA